MSEQRAVETAQTANILHGRCDNDCKVTWHGYHGPNRSIPGTSGGPGDVRLCPHGRVWIYERTAENRFFCEMDLWRRVSHFWEPRTYRRAVAALRTPLGEPRLTPAGELAKSVIRECSACKGKHWCPNCEDRRDALASAVESLIADVVTSPGLRHGEGA